MQVVAVNLGSKTTIEWKGIMVETGIFKYPVNHPIFLDFEDVVNDVVIDRKYHGGIEQAVYAYSNEHYAYWKKQFPNADWQYGMFGENLTISNLEESKIRVGNIYKLGNALVEVTKPREPCFKLGIRFGNQDIVEQFWNSSKSGMYFKILEPGEVEVMSKMELIYENKQGLFISEVYNQKRIKNKKG